MTSRDGPDPRCPDLNGTLRSLAGIFGTSPDVVERALPEAAAAVAADPIAEVERAIVPALVTTLRRSPTVPSHIHFFHGTRVFEPAGFAQRGLLPLPAALDDIWTRLAALAPEISPPRFAALRDGLDKGRIEALTYKTRIDGRDDGPNGALVRDILVNPEAYGSSQFARIPEIVEDICLAAHAEFKIDLETRFEQAATPCIVEFAAPARKSEQAISAACWYAEAAQRGQTAGGDDPFCNFDGQGAAVPPEDIIAVEVFV